MYEWSSEYAARVQAQQAANKGAYDLMPTMDACVEMLRKHAEIRHYLEVVKALVEHKDTIACFCFSSWCPPGAESDITPVHAICTMQMCQQALAMQRTARTGLLEPTSVGAEEPRPRRQGVIWR